MIKGIFWLIDEELLAFPFDSSYLKGIAVIYMSPHISESYVEIIKRDFDISCNCIVRYDYSKHYHCYLDKDGI